MHAWLWPWPGIQPRPSTFFTAAFKFSESVAALAAEIPAGWHVERRAESCSSQHCHLHLHLPPSLDAL
jgi:hypothetical protein